MQKIFFFIILFGLSTSVFAHESSVPLEKGEVKLSLYWAMTGGAEYITSYQYGEDGDLNSITQHAMTTEYDYSVGGSVFLFEYGIFDYLSVGVNISLIEFFTHKVLYNNWTLYGAPYIRFSLPGKILDLPALNMHFVSKIFISPIFSLPEERKSNWMGDGLVNFYNTLSFNYNILKRKNFGLHLYLDIKHISTIINQNYGARPFDISEFFSCMNYTAEQIANIDVYYGGMNLIAITPGIEMEWGFFNLHLGFNIPLYQYSLSPKSFTGPDQLLSNLFFNNLDFAWSFRF